MLDLSAHWRGRCKLEASASGNLTEWDINVHSHASRCDAPGRLVLRWLRRLNPIVYSGRWCSLCGWQSTPGTGTTLAHTCHPMIHRPQRDLVTAEQFTTERPLEAGAAAIPALGS
jgi:hypothetical protein